MKTNLFTFIERNDSNKEFENHLNASAMAHVRGGKSAKKITDYCDPWYSCDAWNCNPDCTCKGNFC